MKKVIILCIVMMLHTLVYADFQGMLMKTAIDLITKPNEFFIEINTDIENTSPIPFNKRFQIQTAPVWDAMTFLNLQVKYNVIPEAEVIPEITPGLSYWNFIGSTLLPSESLSFSAQGYTPFLTISKEFETDLKLFTGAKYTMGSIKLSLGEDNEEQSASDAVSFNLESLANIDSRYNELGFYAGINYLRLDGKDVLGMVGYYPSIKKMYSKIQLTGKIFDHGVSFYPDSFLLFHYYMNIHFSL